MLSSSMYVRNDACLTPTKYRNKDELVVVRTHQATTASRNYSHLLPSNVIAFEEPSLSEIIHGFIQFCYRCYFWAAIHLLSVAHYYTISGTLSHLPLRTATFASVPIAKSCMFVIVFGQRKKKQQETSRTKEDGLKNRRKRKKTTREEKNTSKRTSAEYTTSRVINKETRCMQMHKSKTEKPLPY